MRLAPPHRVCARPAPPRSSRPHLRAKVDACHVLREGILRGDVSGYAPTAWNPPSTWRISPVVAGNQSESNATQARPTGVGSLRSQPRGARDVHVSSNWPKPGIDFA